MRTYDSGVPLFSASGIFPFVALLDGASAVRIYVMGSRPGSICWIYASADNVLLVIAIEMRLMDRAGAVISMPTKRQRRDKVQTCLGVITESRWCPPRLLSVVLLAFIKMLAVETLTLTAPFSE